MDRSQGNWPWPLVKITETRKAGEVALHGRISIVLDAAHSENPGEGDFLGPCVEILSKGDQKPKDKAIREQVLVGEEHGASSALRKEGETEGRTANPGRWVLVDLIWNGTTAREERQRTRRTSSLPHRYDLHDVMFKSKVTNN